ncbi:replication protein A 70 kDa DNA-binding subunit C-like protein [Tanacetum coccineum]
MSTKPAGTSLSTKITDMVAPSHSNRPLFLDELEVDGTSSIIVMSNMIHCTAKATIAHNFLRLKEGGVFLIKNFAVRPNKDEFWVFRHDMFMLEFDGSTTIRKVSANGVGFVRYTFQLVDFDDIELINNKYMIDVSGYVTNVGRTSQTKSGSKTLDFYLANQRGKSLRVTLWGGVGDSLIETKTAHVGMCTIVLTLMIVKTYNNKLYFSSTSLTVIYDNDDIPSLQELKLVTRRHIEPKKEMMMANSSQPREGTVENLMLWARNRKNNAVTFQCEVMIEDIRRKSGWNYPSCGGEKCRKSVSRKAGKLLCKTCNRTVDYPVLWYRLEVVVDDDTAQTVVVMFNEIATELLNCSADSLIEAEDEVCFCYLFQPLSYIETNLHIQSAEDYSGLPTAIRNLIGTTHVMELKSHSYYEYGIYESFTYWKINPADLVDGVASSSNQLITVDDSDASFKGLSRQPSVCTPSKPNEEKRKESSFIYFHFLRTELEDSDTDEVLCLAKDPHEINADGPVNKKKMKMRIDEDSNSV